MRALSSDLRNDLARAIRAARRAAEAGARKALEALAVDRVRAHDSMDEDARALRARLRAHGKQLGDARAGNETQALDRLAHEVAYEHWHRMLFARFLAENHLLVEPASGQPISMDECRELASERAVDPWQLAASFAQRMLPRIFRAGDPALEVRLPPETRQALERELDALPAVVFASDDGLGWTYQFWQADRKDEVNTRGVKIGAEELPAVTQLFTEHYMVLFLFHNTIGAWRAAKVLAARPDLAAAAGSEAELREAARLGALGGYTFDYLRFVREPRDGDEDAKPSGPWRPAAGAFDGWPRRASDLRVLDPCCGSGHFLVEALHLLVRLRMEEDGLPVADAIRAVVADNLFGLEIDPRCTQIAAFNVALAAWKLAGGPIELPPMNIACSGLAPNAAKDDWLKLADEAAAAAGVPARADLLGRDESLWSARARQGLSAVHDLFTKAPVLGSLIDPRVVAADLLQADFGEVEPLLSPVLAREGLGDEQRERAVAAQGMARAASLLAGRYTLVITNVPYLGRGKQDDVLKAHLEDHFTAGKADLATAFVQRGLAFCAEGGTAALVTPQNWLFLTTYRKLREELLRSAEWNVVARLGPGAFETISGEVVNVALLEITNRAPRPDVQFAGLDVSAPRGQKPIRAAEKAALLRRSSRVGVAMIGQSGQLTNPNTVVQFDEAGDALRLSVYATSHRGHCNGDSLRFERCFWEIRRTGDWVFLQSAPESTRAYAGRSYVLFWEQQRGSLFQYAEAQRKVLKNVHKRGSEAWGHRGLVVMQMNDLPFCLYSGEIFDGSCATVVPLGEQDLPALWAYAESGAYGKHVRAMNTKVNVENGFFVQVPFDVAYWQRIAAEKYPNGLPDPESDDPTQWLFHGRPEHSTEPLQVAVARLLGYRWPAELDPEMRLSERARALVKSCEALLPFADRDGIVCLPSVRGEQPAADRLLSLLTACAVRPDRDLDDWLRTSFFEEHCKLFHHRPFVWHVWDGRADGFQALVNYHRLAAPNGEGRRTLEALAYSYLGDWIERQRADQQAGKEGADGRLAAALDLQAQLERILEGEPPYDIFVRWKPLHEQPMGWDPDINDGVRLNIRPFLSASLRKGGRAGAGILRWKPNIHWKKDRGEEPKSIRPAADYPWFWSCPGNGSDDDRTNFVGGPEFDGSRWNDLHYTRKAKERARESTGGAIGTVNREGAM